LYIRFIKNPIIHLNKKNMKHGILLFTILIFIVGTRIYVSAQGVTTSAITGKVIDSNGGPVYLANIVALHEPTGTLYGATSGDDGYFNIRNMRIGGPYTVTVTFVGYKDGVEQNIYLQLNNTYKVDMTLIEAAGELGEVVISANQNNVIDPDHTGAKTSINKQEITSMPTLKRSQEDLTRLTPQSNGNSFNGHNNLYNNFSLDGSIFNNPFGLDYATPGGQTDAQPVSLDAIEQIGVSIAPFDVREGGFTGAGVNAVTKSGTNDFTGSAYYYFKNHNLIGSTVGNTKSPNVDFSSNLFGFTVGGPIVKNKLFFFISAEGERRNEVAHGWLADNGENTGEANVTTVNEDSIRMVQTRLRDYWNYEPGAYQQYNHETYNNKLLVKLDWNVSKNHQITLRYNMLDAWKDILPHPEAIIGRGPTSFRLPFENSSYQISNKINSIVGEWNSNYNNKWSNRMIFGYTQFRDSRTPHSAQYPVIDIFNQYGELAITMGSEMFSTHNILNQDVWQFTDNITLYADRHTITMGVNFERFYFENSFNLFYYPWFTFGSVKDFLANDSVNGINFNATVGVSNKKAYNWAYVDVGQLGVYAQDEFQVNDKLNLIFGLRIDIPMYFNDIPYTEAVQEVVDFDGWVDEDGNSAKVNPSQWPKSQILWSPRIGFNWNVKGKDELQVRGGTGIFTGRIPFVWLGNQASNSGIYTGYTFQVNSTIEDFKWPQSWKTDLAFDWKFAKGWLGTFEAIYSKDVNQVVHRNYNMDKPTGSLTGTGDTRQIFTSFSESNIYSSSEGSIGFLDAGTIVLDNVKEGHQFSLTAQLTKVWDFGLSIMGAYTYLDSKDYTSIPAEIAADAFQRNPVVGNPNTPSVSWSRYGVRNRIIASAFYKLTYNFMASHFGIFIEAAQGQRYSFVYAGDLNRDAISNNDLLYVPENMNDIHFGTVDENGIGIPAPNAADQWAALNNFIENDPYLSERRGKYAERNAAQLPWWSQFDFKFMQDFNFKTGKKQKVNTIQLSLDVVNLGNMFNSNWGVIQLPKTVTPVTVEGVDNSGVPFFRFDENLNTSYVQDVSINSKWQMQIGIRYIFN
jgi:hypothetical protein